MIVTLDSKRRLTLPASLMEARPGQSFDVRFDAEMDDVPARRRELPKKRKL